MGAGCGRVWYEGRGRADAGELDAQSGEDAAPGDGGPPPALLFATIGESLVKLDAETGDAELAVTLDVSLEWMTFDGTSLVALAPLPPDGWFLTFIDPCTGSATPGPRVSMGATAVPQIEGLAYLSSTGKLFAPVSLDAADDVSETLATIDPATGEIDVVGPIDTTSGRDLDRLAEVGGRLLGGDTVITAGIADTHYFDVDPTTAATAPRGVSEGEHVTELAYDRNTGALYGWVIGGTLPGHLVRVDPDTGDLTDVGQTHAADEFAGADLNALAVAYPVCE